MRGFSRLLSLFSSLGFAAQLVAGMALATLVVAVAAGYTARQHERTSLAALATQEDQSKARLLAHALLDDIIAEDLPQLETTVHELVRSDDAVFSVTVCNEENVVLLNWQRELLAVPKRLLQFDEEIVLQGEKFGAVKIVWDATAADAQVAQKALLVALWVAGACIALSVVICAFIYFFAIVPIDRMAKHLNEFRHGVFDRLLPLPAVASRELRRLDESVNALGEFLTLRERREAELRAAKNTAESSNRTKSEFLATMSHELRTPLNAINGFSEMMAMETFGPLGNERYGDYAQQINNSGKHLLSLISDILDVSRMEVGKLELAWGEVDLADTIRSSLVMLEDRAAKGGLRMTTDLAADLPRLSADERRLKQVVLNLVGNAIKFTPAGGTVHVRASWHPSFGAIVSVSDTGIGIAADKLGKVMEPFGQADSSLSRRHDGAGLGLPLSKALVELHGGTLRLQSAPDRGTEATFDLPASLAIEWQAASIEPGQSLADRMAGLSEALEKRLPRQRRAAAERPAETPGKPAKKLH